MRLLTVCGSLQRRSSNRAALDVVSEVAATAGATLDDFDRLVEIAPFDPDRTDDAIDAIDDWRRRTRAADAVVVAAPEYAGALAGAVKNAFDWLAQASSTASRSRW
jgi:chromate reductase